MPNTDLWSRQQYGPTDQGAEITGMGSMTGAQHDDLAGMFERNMYLSQRQHNHQGQLPQQQQQSDSISSLPSQSSPFVSSHYTGTAYLQQQEQEHLQPQRQQPDQLLEATLRQHSIDPATLMPAQIDLFRHAQSEQKLRLLELWRISPPLYPQRTQERWGHDADGAGEQWTTSVELEEQLARDRWDMARSGLQLLELKRLQQQAAQLRMKGAEEHMLDTYLAPTLLTNPPNGFPTLDITPYDNHQQQLQEPISPIRDHHETAWPPAARMRAASIASSFPASAPAQPSVGQYTDQPASMNMDMNMNPNPLGGPVSAEPYMSHGYQSQQDPQGMQGKPNMSILAEPVYAAAAGLWHRPINHPRHTISQSNAFGENGSYGMSESNGGANGGQGGMEDQYGLYEQIRNHADWEARQRGVAAGHRDFGAGGESGRGGEGGGGEDEEMVM